ncbi:MAG: hypothetical protein H0T47_16595 [Planctomycetaceae bacterium]|nr:hypothetical protein [Planctomycetaceae bacterium]
MADAHRERQGGLHWRHASGTRREPGDYFLEAFAAGECVASRKIRVFEPPEPSPGHIGPGGTP